MVLISHVEEKLDDSAQRNAVPGLGAQPDVQGGPAGRSRGPDQGPRSGAQILVPQLWERLKDAIKVSHP